VIRQKHEVATQRRTQPRILPEGVEVHRREQRGTESPIRRHAWTRRAGPWCGCRQKISGL